MRSAKFISVRRDGRRSLKRKNPSEEGEPNVAIWGKSCEKRTMGERIRKKKPWKDRSVVGDFWAKDRRKGLPEGANLTVNGETTWQTIRKDWGTWDGGICYLKKAHGVRDFFKMSITKG